jgi:hypothetical protein
MEPLSLDPRGSCDLGFGMNDIDRLRELYVGVWDGADPAGPPDGRAYDSGEQSRNEAELRAFAGVLASEARRAHRRGASKAGERRVMPAFARFAVNALDWKRDWFEGDASTGFEKALRDFPVQARQFDPTLSPAEIYQAARNALTMHCLQALLGLRVEFTRAVLAYSLLYPYTDNLLDDPDLAASQKLGFGLRLGRRLRGGSVEPSGEREARIFELVAMIERQFPRAQFPPLFDSLLAIHDAQMKSLALLSVSPGSDPRMLVRIAVEKGGTSVLADGYLVAGTLTPAQAECIFGLGVFLQLRDDLEDVEDDAAHGVRTVFSSRRHGQLDEPAARSLAVGRAVLDRLSCFDRPSSAPIRAVMAQSLRLTITDAAASFPSRFGQSFLQALERRSPFRLTSITAARRRVSKANGTLTALLERWLEEAEAGAAS